MNKNITGLLDSSKTRTLQTIDKVNAAINEMLENGSTINFNIVSKLSGVSKSFIYKNAKLKTTIEDMRNKQINENLVQKRKFDKTSKAKDIIIAAKDKKITQLEVENNKLKLQLQILHAKIYERD